MNCLPTIYVFGLHNMPLSSFDVSTWSAVGLLIIKYSDDNDVDDDGDCVDCDRDCDCDYDLDCDRDCDLDDTLSVNGVGRLLP